jgi:hypothetical protein
MGKISLGGCTENYKTTSSAIMDAPQLSVVEKSKLYSDQLNRFLTFKNKINVPPQAPVQRTPLMSYTPVSAEIQPQMSATPVPVEILPQVPATPYTTQSF